MKRNHYYIIWTCLSAILIFNSCSKDLGNYDYQDINEIKITGVAEEYALMRTIDTLRIQPDVVNTLANGDEEDRFDYFWILQIPGERIPDTIGFSKDLEYPVALEPVDHDLQFRVVDKGTGVSWWANTTLNVGTPFSRGILLIGEDEQGAAEAEMLSMMSDTLLLKHILSESGFPRLENPISFVHTGGTSFTKLWVFTKGGSYYLDPLTMKGTTANRFGNLVYTTDPINLGDLHPVVLAPQIRTAAGAISSTSLRAIITNDGHLFGAYLIINGGDFYTNPLNRTADNYDKLLKAAPYLLYSTGSMNAVTWYDTDNERFLHFSQFGFGTTSTILEDQGNDPFPWNQVGTGRSLVYAENTRNTDGGSTHGNSFAIMKDENNKHFVYKFYANGSNPLKRAAYTVSSIATDFDKADFYAFSSNRSVIFYSVGNRLYAYDYNPGNERLYQFPAVGTDEITMLKFDTQIDHQENSLYIATYNATTKGTLRRFIVGSDPNVVELTPAENGEWNDLIKVKNINWRGAN